MQGRGWSLRTHLAILVATIVVSMAATLGTFVADVSRAQVSREAGETLHGIAAQAADRLDAQMAARGRWASAASTTVSPDEPGAAARLLEGMRAADPSIAWAGVADASGKVVAATGGLLVGVDISRRPVFANARDSLFLGDVHEAVLLARALAATPGTTPLFVDAAAPIRGPSGETVGVAAFHYGWEWARDVTRAIATPVRARRGVGVLVVDAGGQVVLGPDAMIGKPAPRLSAQGDAVAGGYSAERWTDGEFVVGYARTGLFGWTVIARQSADYASATSDVILEGMVLWGAVLALVFSALGWVACGHVTRPLAAISAAADRIGDGATGERLPLVRGTVEIERLSSSLRAMLDGLTRQRAAIAELRDVADTDALTGLANRRAFDRRLSGLAGREADGAVALMLVDLDSFKPVNDRLGHQAGDEVLRAVARRMEGELRGCDMAARIGGDEFAVALAAGAGKEEALAVARRIVAAVSAPVPLEGGGEARVGCTVGVAFWPEHGPGAAEALERADQALYGAKRAGKNRAAAWAAEG